MKRPWTGPAAWHVFDRGSRRLELFRDDQDRRMYLSVLETALEVSEAELWAYALMSNHDHLILYGDSDQLTRCMGRLKTDYAVYHNRRYGLSGAAFEGPYHAYTQGSRYLLRRRLAYVCLNPEKAGLRGVSDSWLWTSLPAYTGVADGPPPLKVEVDAALAAIDPDPQAALALIHQSVEKERRRPDPPRGGHPRACDLQLDQFEWLLEYAEEQRFALGNEDPVEVAAYWGYLTGVPLRVMGRRLQMRTYSVRDWLGRFRSSVDADPARRQRLSLP